MNPPKLSSQKELWRWCDIKDCSKVNEIFREFNPTHVFHLAARANLNGNTVEDFSDNILGTANVIQAVNNIASLERFIHVSTQYVVRPGIYPSEEF